MNVPAEAQSILIVDDDDVLCARLVRAFAQRGYEARGARTFEQALLLAQQDAPELAVVDLRIGDRNGLELVGRLLAIEPSTRVVVLTGYGSIATAVDAVRLGAVHYLQKPADVDDILLAFSRAARPPSVGPNADYRAPSLARAEWEHIQRVLTDCGGNISEAARRLNIHRRSLQRKLTKYPPAD
jgi:two-component system response regulator RegA